MPADRICEELERRKARGDSFERLLSGSVELLHECNPRFHWAGIYELFPATCSGSARSSGHPRITCSSASVVASAGAPWPRSAT